MNDVTLDQRMLDQLRMLERAGKVGVFRQMVGMFQRSSAEQVAGILAASADGDAERLRVGSHTLKSNAASFGATALSELCRDIEYAAKAGTGRLTPEQAAELRRLQQASSIALDRERP
jgi:HPt (histidine-containing phosphotransfer) domain-containing protein